MSTWQRRARLAVAVVGVVSAVVVYRAIGQRRPQAAPPPVERLDPAASVESTAAVLQRVHGDEEDFEITQDRSLTYPDGSTKLFGVTISVRNKSGRDFTVRAREARAGEGQRTLELEGGVRVVASDGLDLQTEKATYSRDEDVVRAPGPVSFQNGRMSGGGVGMLYDKRNDVLQVPEQAQVTMRPDDAGEGEASFSAGAAVLDRTQNYLQLTGAAHVVRGSQVLDGDQATARLSEDEQVITQIELREHSRVSGGAALESMTARDMNLAYSEDGATLRHVSLSGEAAVAMKPERTERGRRLAGETLELELGADGRLVGAQGTGGVRLDLPAATGRPGRSVRGRTFTSSGAEGVGLTEARFNDSVEYGEDPSRTTAARSVRARALALSLSGDAIRSAVFSGAVTFEEAGGMRAGAAELTYAPEAGTLRLRGSDAGGGPRVDDAQIGITAQSIDAGIDDHRMSASGAVKTTLRSGDGRGRDPQRLPGLFEQGRPVNVNASRLEYAGDTGSAVYTGDATLWQGETAVRADGLRLDRANGDLVATGSARATVLLDGSLSVGQGQEIRYTDAARVLALEVPAPAAGRPGDRGGAEATARTGGRAATAGGGRAGGRGAGEPAPPATGRGATPVEVARLTGPQGDLRALRIEVVLARDEGRVERLEGYRRVDLVLKPRHATADRLTYLASEESYRLEGTPTAPVRVDDGCRATTGKTLTFFRSTDRILVDGNEEVRTQTRSGASCDQPSAR